MFSRPPDRVFHKKPASHHHAESMGASTEAVFMIYAIDEELVAKTSDGPKHLERNQTPRRNHRGDCSAPRTDGRDEILDHPSFYLVPRLRANHSASCCDGT